MSRLITLDRVLSVEPGKGGRALRNVPNTLAIFDSHFPRFPVLPGVLILGSLGQLAALVLQEQTGKRWRLVGAERMQFRRFIEPGDQMELTVELKELTADAAVFSGSVRVDSQLRTSVRTLRLAPEGAGGGP